jgi:hypothetical protein
VFVSCGGSHPDKGQGNLLPKAVSMLSQGQISSDAALNLVEIERLKG